MAARARDILGDVADRGELIEDLIIPASRITPPHPPRNRPLSRISRREP